MSDEHIDVGAYALGLLEDEDSTAFEAHLAHCPSCHAELAEFSPMKALLTGLEPVEAFDHTAERGVVDLLSRRAAASRRRVRWTVAVGAAACLAALGGGLAAGFAVAPSNPPPGTAVLAGQLHSATNPQNGVTGTVGLVTKTWGTYVSLDLADVRGPLECELIAVSKTGERRVVTGWVVGVPGDGVPGHPAHLLVQGGTAISVANLARFDVIVVNGKTLLSIPV
jgi:putative zinc finger protein